MKYDVVIEAIKNPKAKSVIARHLAHDPSISMQKAMSMLLELPIVYATNLTLDEARFNIRQLETIQVAAKAVPVQAKKPLKNVSAPFVPEHKKATAEPETNQTKKPAYEPPAEIIVNSARLDPPQKTPRLNQKFSRILTIVIVAAILVLVIVNRKSLNLNHLRSLDWSKQGIIQQEQQILDTKVQAKYKNLDSLYTDKLDSVMNASLQAQNDTVVSYPSQQEIAHAQKLLDSAKQILDQNHAITFYKLAIAFNRHNINAWYGLRDAYKQSMMAKEALETENAMTRLFGNNVFSLSKIVERTGQVMAMTKSQTGTYRIEYASLEKNRDKAMFNAFLLIKSMHTSCDCHAMSLYVHLDGKAGILVYAKVDVVPASFDDFVKKAEITQLQ